MSIIDRVGGALRTLFGASPSHLPRAHGLGLDAMDMLDLNDPRLRLFLGAGAESRSGMFVTRETALKVATVYRCYSILTGLVATLPLEVKRRVDGRTREDASDHPLWQVLRRRPNGWQTPGLFRRQLMGHVLFHGNAYARIVRSGRRIVALLPLDARGMSVRQRVDGSLAYTYASPAGGRADIPQDEILHLRGPSLDGYRGLSVLGHARESIGLSLSAEALAADTMRNGTAPSSVLTHPGSLSGEAYGRLKASVEDYRAGKSGAGGTIILEEGAKFERLGLSLGDAKYLESKELSALEICMFFGVPPHMVGLTSKQTSWGSGIEQQSIGFVTYTAIDWLKMWEEALEFACIGPHDGPIYLRFDVAGLLRGDLKARAAYYKTMFETGSFSPNDIRAKEDENPREGGDEYYVGLNLGSSNAVADDEPMDPPGPQP